MKKIVKLTSEEIRQIKKAILTNKSQNKPLTNGLEGDFRSIIDFYVLGKEELVVKSCC